MIEQRCDKCGKLLTPRTARDIFRRDRCLLCAILEANKDKPKEAKM